ncbi:kinase-like domain-containing protein [Podospora appendiculata]|uniref:Kinase-like domain-containing protein n=1 Tax=Podospora appendiculata TaxID=314037 RepID=A0AAE1C717_9PEZI|nr:kinase-like domain-containing protein [Podospora appendiculata]
MADDYNDEDGASSIGQQPLSPPAFILVPLNTAARKAVEHVRNKYWHYQNNNTFGLWIDFSDPTRLHYTVGRTNTDIYLPEMRAAGKGSSQISDLHASFQLVKEAGAVLLLDHSENRETEPFSGSHGGGFTVKFRSNRNSVLVARGINPRIAFGHDRWYQFELHWRSPGMYGFPQDEPYIMGPRQMRNKRYVQGERVGGGAYGNVWWALDSTTGEIMAIKKFHNLSGKNLEFATREVANLFLINKSTSIQHEHILQIIDSAGGGPNDNWGEIFMPLKDGNLKALVESPNSVIDDFVLSNLVLRQMLLALQCIASHKIVHRDIKPENILWEYQDGAGEEPGYHFCLGDFGLSNDPKLARTVAGTEPFMAPEVYLRQPQSTKVDIWSLFATVVWVRNTSGFRPTCAQLGAQQIHTWLNRIATSHTDYTNIANMASLNPKKRPSASQQLAILDQWDGTSPTDNLDTDYNTNPTDETNDLNAHFARAMNLHDGGGGNGNSSSSYSAPYGDPPGISYATSASRGTAGSIASATSPEIPYYEPYTSGLMDNYPWEAVPDGGGGDQAAAAAAGPINNLNNRYEYVPPPVGSSDGPRDRHVRCSNPLPVICPSILACCLAVFSHISRKKRKERKKENWNCF